MENFLSYWNVIMIKLSIILPFYNVEKYLAACLDSLYAQDIPEDEYEVICIDDCSPDRSRDIVLQYQKSHNNLILLSHKENKGLGGARNTGIRVARGKYLWMVDSDDRIKPDCLKGLIEICEKNALDILMFNFEKINISGEKVEEIEVFNNSEVIPGRQYIHRFFKNEFVYHLGYVWRQIYRTEYLREKELYFPEKVFWEDTVFMPKALFYADKVCSVNKICYRYRINPSSVSSIYDKELKADLIFQFAFGAGKDLLDFSKEIQEMDQETAINLYEKACWYINSFVFRILRSNKNQKKQFFQLIRSNKADIKQLLPYMNGLNKILCRYPATGYTVSRFITPFYKFRRRLKHQKRQTL
jgi:glycosyltransferase involved in cell wall biosynthesis